MRIRATCRCGATFETSTVFAQNAWDAYTHWRDDHDHAAQKTAPARRKSMSDERIARVRKIFSDGGNIQTVMQAEGVGERQAWRLKRLADEGAE